MRAGKGRLRRKTKNGWLSPVSPQRSRNSQLEIGALQFRRDQRTITAVWVAGISLPRRRPGAGRGGCVQTRARAVLMCVIRVSACLVFRLSQARLALSYARRPAEARNGECRMTGWATESATPKTHSTKASAHLITLMSPLGPDTCVPGSRASARLSGILALRSVKAPALRAVGTADHAAAGEAEK